VLLVTPDCQARLALDCNVLEAFSILGGNVGIGTTAPQAMLDLRPVIFSQQAQSGGIQLAATDGHFASGMFLRVNSGGQPRLALDCNSLEALSILGGNVGIGTGNPHAPLEIVSRCGTEVL